MNAHPFSRSLLVILVASAAGCRAVDERTDSPEQSVASETSGPRERGTTPRSRDQVDDDGVVRRGEPLSLEEAIPVSKAFARAFELNGRKVQVRGTVDAVCRKKGCWMAITSRDGSQSIRVTFEDYAFFVPRRSPGLVATVEGQLEVGTLDVETARHFEEDRVAGTGEAPRRIRGPKREIAIVASGLELREAPEPPTSG